MQWYSEIGSNILAICVAEKYFGIPKPPIWIEPKTGKI